MLAVEPAEQGYNASYIYCDEETMYIARDQMKLLEGRLPQKEDEVVVSRYFLSNYGADAGIGEKVMLSSESFHGEYTVTGILEGYKEKEVNGTSILLSKEALKGWSGYDPADYRAYVHFKNEQQMDETELTARSKEIAKEYQLEMPIMNLSYMKFYKQPVNVSMLALVAGIAVLVIIGGYVVIQSISLTVADADFQQIKVGRLKSQGHCEVFPGSGRSRRPHGKEGLDRGRRCL